MCPPRRCRRAEAEGLKTAVDGRVTRRHRTATLATGVPSGCGKSKVRFCADPSIRVKILELLAAPRLSAENRGCTKSKKFQRHARRKGPAQHRIAGASRARTRLRG